MQVHTAKTLDDVRDVKEFQGDSLWRRATSFLAAAASDPFADHLRWFSDDGRPVACVQVFLHHYPKIERTIQKHDYEKDLCNCSQFEIVIVAVEHGKAVGFGSLEGNTVTALYVRSTHRGKGIGRALHTMLEAEAIKNGEKSLEVEAFQNAVGFYCAIGYTQTSEKVWYLGETPIPNVMLSKSVEHGNVRQG